jgi:phage terminase large subunit
MANLDIDYKPNPIYLPIYDTNWSELILIGGRGSGKSFEASQFTALNLIKGKRVVIIRDVATTIKESIFTEISQRVSTIQEQLPIKLLDVLESEVKKGSDTMLFSKGMRKSRTEQKTDLKGLSNVDIAILEEVEDIRDVERVDTLLDTLRKENVKVVFILNTPDIEHWIIKRYFDLVPAKVDNVLIPNFFSLVPKKIEGVLQIFSTYLDNSELPAKKQLEYLNYSNPKYYKFNLEHYYNHILGFARAKREGLIFENWEIIEDDDFELIEINSKFGMDFGSNDPTVLVETKIKDNCIYIKEHFYLSNLTIDDIYNFSKHVILKIKADSSAKQTIESLKAKGLWIEPCLKGKDSVNFGIRKLQSYNKMYITRSSKNIQLEAQNYIWETDKNGNATDKPIDKFNHGWDSVRYSDEDETKTSNYIHEIYF